ncbi:glycosyltransferase [Blastopirellula sp. JC732]|uniref:Glycosyltransferase n=1 Tax=Blastopirellula sediminis TaxID=2894196 RepID=A0A9X1SL65_9BACT|nr:glycosyltransferase [Blastopirellula sediminis]MCC9606328.1 glycosyltransferase [Blastopirellula sediminis]MCC9630374.1 glycosyltransferase [Blastopirellula sediminis]
MPSPEVTVIVSSYQRPWNLRRSLESLAMQRGVNGAFEVVVTDDGSQDETEEIVEQFAATVDFPLTLTSHPHDGFQVGKCRNEGITVSHAPYLIFLDGDLVASPNFVAQHLQHRQRGHAMVGDTFWLSQDVTETIRVEDIRNGNFRAWASELEERRMRWKALRAAVYCQLRLSDRPRIKGCHVALWRDDYEAINGYDQDFIGWGLEDSDLQRRLYLSGVRFASSMRWARTYHLWHPRDPSYVSKAKGTDNEKLMQANRPFRCVNGLGQRDAMTVRRFNVPQTARRAA